MLERLGLARIEQLHPLPRAALTARFGAELVTRLEQALRPARRADLAAPPLPAHRAQLALAEPLLEAEALARAEPAAARPSSAPASRPPGSARAG